MDQNYTFDQIEAYLDNLLDPDEKKAFEADLKADNDLRQEVEAHRATRKVVEVYASHRTHEKVQQLFADQQKSRSSGFSSGLLRIAAAVAVVFALGISYFYLQVTPDASQLAANYMEPYPDRITTMGAGENDILSQAIHNYNQKNYEAAITDFQKISEDHPQYSLVQLYIGVAALQTEQEDLSITTLEPLTAASSDYQSAAQWYLALAYLKKSDKAAIPLLKKLVANEGYKAQSAQKILDALDE